MINCSPEPRPAGSDGMEVAALFVNCFFSPVAFLANIDCSTVADAVAACVLRCVLHSLLADDRLAVMTSHVVKLHSVPEQTVKYRAISLYRGISIESCMEFTNHCRRRAAHAALSLYTLQLHIHAVSLLQA